MKLIDYWPTPGNVGDCIKGQAETISDAVFLAVHQPVQFLRRVIRKPDQVSKCSEKDFLAAFTEPRLDSGALLFPILGDSGIGKSHMIRWLDIQLKRLEDGVDRHIIRIPKSSSLKTVLELILRDLKGKVYEKIRQQVFNARDNLDQRTASRLFARFLTIRLREEAERLEREVETETTAGGKVDEEKDSERACCLKLYALLEDGSLDSHFKDVLKRITRHIATERDEKADGESPEFKESDFKIASELLEDANKPAKQAYRFFKRKSNLEVALKVLKANIDSALHQLLELGDNSLSGLFEQVRKELLKEGRELVLLVEDFVCLQGIQEALLAVAIKEAYVGGGKGRKQELCVMRTALASTTGYIDQSTVQTRAEFEWVIEDAPSDESSEQRLDRMANFVGSYLNAARLGEKTLVKAYTGKGDLFDWIPQFGKEKSLDEEEQQLLEAFGYSAREFSLFPFNKQAIRQLGLELPSSVDGDLNFNPREVISYILRDKLRDGRSSFENGSFPIVDQFAGASTLPGTVREYVQTRVRDRRDTELINRYYALLKYWGDDPYDPEKIQGLHPRVYQTFGLKPLDPDARPPLPSDVKADSKDPEQKPAAPTAVVDPEEEQARFWQQEIDRWATGQKQLGQSEANQVRKALLECVERYIDWDPCLRSPLPDFTNPNNVYIPFARGAVEAENALIVVCLDKDLKDDLKITRLSQALQALMRHHVVYKGKWDYTGGDEDCARFRWLVDSLAEKALKRIEEDHYPLDEDPIEDVAGALLLGAKVLGFEGAYSEEIPGLLTALLDPGVGEPGPGNRIQSPTDWDQFKSLLHDRRGIEGTPQICLLQILLARIGARQGGGGKIYSIDAARLEKTVEDFDPTAFIDVSKERKVTWRGKGAGTEESEIFNALDELKGFTKARDERFKELSTWLKDTKDWLGDEKPDVKALSKLIEETASVVRSHIGGDPHEFRNLEDKVRDFGECGFTEILAEIEELSEDGNSKEDLKILATADEETLKAIRELRHESLRIFEDKLGVIEAMSGEEGENVQKALSDLIGEVEQVGDLLEKVVGRAGS